jgi:general stress protein CsbA
MNEHQADTAEPRERRSARNIRLVVAIIGIAFPTIILWSTRAEGVDPYRESIIIGVVLAINSALAFPYLLGIFRTVRWSIYAGVALLLTTGLMFASILTSASSTANLGFIALVCFNTLIVAVGRAVESRVRSSGSGP